MQPRLAKSSVRGLGFKPQKNSDGSRPGIFRSVWGVLFKAKTRKIFAPEPSPQTDKKTFRKKSVAFFLLIIQNQERPQTDDFATRRCSRGSRNHQFVVLVLNPKKTQTDFVPEFFDQSGVSFLKQKPIFFCSRAFTPDSQRRCSVAAERVAKSSVWGEGSGAKKKFCRSSTGSSLTAACTRCKPYAVNFDECGISSLERIKSSHVDHMSTTC